MFNIVAGVVGCRRYSGRFSDGSSGGSANSSPGVYSSVPPPSGGFRGQFVYYVDMHDEVDRDSLMSF